ncbi:hypothetical protein JD844_027846 [Phrynosoma platyrhinos]|uniref:Uncharacterized protein n=1 Tax=Phrynosoma platyrhinos TaxID=52577 RepID=A0ABQ7SGW2_PHRPL|nr:hypothetical protein JD844_027846 [Phrynosoma platyrhinos]
MHKHPCTSCCRLSTWQKHFYSPRPLMTYQLLSVGPVGDCISAMLYICNSCYCHRCTMLNMLCMTMVKFLSVNKTACCNILAMHLCMVVYFDSQDGGLLLNNPTALAVHECKCLWPNVPLQCVVSLGTGRYDSEGKTHVTYTSLKAKLTNVISSATDTEEIHTMLDALLPPDTYFRFNPLMNEDIALDENRREKLNQLQTDGIRYLERNEEKLKKAAKILTQEKTTLQRLNDWMRLKADMYEGLPFFSKL